MSDLAAVLVLSAAPLVGMVLIGLPWLAWSKRRKAQQDSQNIVALLEWVEQMTTEQRMEHGIYDSAHGRNRKRERQVIH